MSVLARLFGDGSVPDDLRAELEAEGVRALAERCPGSITYRNYRAPGKRFGLKKTATRGAIAVTGRRVVVVHARGSRLMDLPLDDPRAAGLTWSADRPDRLCVRFDVAAFHADRSGRMEIRLTTPRAEEILRLVAG